jgi:signal transduction histidine kinase
MGVFRSAGSGRPRGRSVRFTFIAMVAVPVACVVALWALALTGTLDNGQAGRTFDFHNRAELGEFALIVGVGLVIIIVTALVMGSFARRLSHDIADLEETARHISDEQLPQLMERLRRGEHVVAAEEPAARPRTKIAEIRRAAAAIGKLQQTAVAAAIGEAGLRNGIGQVFVSLARRNQSLLQRQLRLIDALEQKADNPAALADLFPLDHLTTRMRRHAEGLIILSGAAPGRSWSEPVPVIDVVRGAVAEIEDYKRVAVLTRAEDAVSGSAVADMVHLLAELIENATLFSPSGTRVEVRAERVANGFTIEVDDRGLGIKASQLATVNQQLASPPDFDLANADQLGLFVVGKLAARHNVQVLLRPSPYGGTTAIVLLPNTIVVPMTEQTAPALPGPRHAAGPPSGLDLPSGEALALTGLRSDPPPLAGGPAPAGPSLFGSDLGTGDFPPPPEVGALDGTAEADAGGLAGPNGSGDAGTYRGLPRRVRQANLSPHLRRERAGQPDDDGASPHVERTPEETRSLVASLQSGWQRGRQADAPDGEPAAGAQAAEGQDAEAPQDEEA